MKFILMGSVLASTLLMGSNGLYINVNDDTLELEADIYLNKHYDVSDNSSYYLSLGHLRTENETKKTQPLSTLGFKMSNPYIDDNGISLGLGMKLVYTNHMSKTFFALPLSLYARVEMNEMIYADVNLSYASKVLSFVDAQTYIDMKTRLNYKVSSDGYFFIGARSIETRYKKGHDIKYDNSGFLGFEVRF